MEKNESQAAITGGITPVAEERLLVLCIQGFQDVLSLNPSERLGLIKPDGCSLFFVLNFKEILDNERNGIERMWPFCYL